MEVNTLMWFTHPSPLGANLVGSLLDKEGDMHTTVGRSACNLRVQHKRESKKFGRLGLGKLDLMWAFFWA